MNKPLASPPATEEPARFSAEEFMAMATEGPLADIAGKIELVDGVILRMNPPNYPHSSGHNEIFRRLDRLLADTPGDLIVGFEIGVRLGEATIRVPDIAVFRDPGNIRGAMDGANLVLVIEIADTSLAGDLGPKRLSYAAAEVPHYWVVDIVNRRVHRMSRPLDGDYAQRDLAEFGEPLMVPGADRALVID